jgi:hypothetical protein
VFGRLAQLAISVIGCPLNGTGFGEIVTCTAPLPLGGTGGCAGVGEGVGDGAGAGVVPPLFDREGTLAVDTFEGEVGSTAPQSMVTNASAIEAMRNGVRIRVRDYARRAPWAGSCTGAARSDVCHTFDAVTSNAP